VRIYDENASPYKGGVAKGICAHCPHLDQAAPETNQGKSQKY
jgi:hypothetical protein